MLRLLADYPRLSQRELAGKLGMSLGKTNYCLRALISHGWIKVQNFRKSDNKAAYAYVLTASGIGAKMRNAADFLSRKQSEFVRLELEIAQLRREVDQMNERRSNSASAPAPGDS